MEVVAEGETTMGVVREEAITRAVQEGTLKRPEYIGTSSSWGRKKKSWPTSNFATATTIEEVQAQEVVVLLEEVVAMPTTVVFEAPALFGESIVPTTQADEARSHSSPALMLFTTTPPSCPTTVLVSSGNLDKVYGALLW